MEIQKMLKFTLIICSILEINCCQRKASKCKNKIASQYCAKIYSNSDCHGQYFGTGENDGTVRDDTDIDRLYSYEVNEGCVLTITDRLPKRSPGDRTGSRDTIYTTYLGPAYGPVDFPSPSHDVGPYTRYSCKCNKYKGCPDHDSINSKTSSGKSMCAIVYQYSTDDHHTSCFGSYKEVVNGEQLTKFKGRDKKWDDDISAIIVRKGCSFTGYENKAYKGTRETFKEVNADVGAMNNRISSYICKCDFPPVEECSPYEAWTRLQRCKNSGTGEYRCRYWKTSGISTSDTTTNLSQFSQSAVVELGIQLKSIFTAKATSISGWTWSDSNAFTKTVTKGESYENSFVVPPGKRFAIYQRVGKCGEYNINVHDYEVRDETTGAVIEHIGQ